MPFFFSSLSLSLCVFLPSIYSAGIKATNLRLLTSGKKREKIVGKNLHKNPPTTFLYFYLSLTKKNVSGPRLFFRPSGAARWLLIFFFNSNLLGSIIKSFLKKLIPKIFVFQSSSMTFFKIFLVSGIKFTIFLKFNFLS